MLQILMSLKYILERLVGGYFVAVPNFDALGICIGEVSLVGVLW